MKFKGVDLTPLMGIGGWAIDVIEKAIPDRVAYTFVENYKAWFLWDFYPTAFLGVHLTYYWGVFEERLPWELAEEVIVKPFKDLRFERAIASMVSYFELVKQGFIEPRVFLEDLVKQYRELRDRNIKIPLLWRNENFVGTFIWGENENGELQPVRIDRLSQMFYAVLNSPKELSENEIPEKGKHWEVVINVLNPATNQYELRGISLVGFFGERFDGADDIATIREEMLESFKRKFEENPDIVKAVEFLLMGTKWYDHFKQLQGELEKVRV